MEKINSDNENLYKALPTAVKERLPKYYRTLRTLIGDDILRTRSADLAPVYENYSVTGKTGLFISGRNWQSGLRLQRQRPVQRNRKRYRNSQ